MQLARSDAPTFSRVLVGDMRPTLVALTAAVALLLFIACVNVGNLMLVRAAARARELSIRRAIGASYGDVVRQLLVEAGMLTMAGGVLGALCGAALLRALVRLAPPQIPRLDEIRFEPATIAIAMLVTMASVMLFGLLPALSAARVNLASSLRLDARGGMESRARRAVRQWLVASQVALALAMLAGAGLLVRSLDRLQRIDLGYRPDHLAIFLLAMPESDDPAKVEDDSG